MAARGSLDSVLLFSLADLRLLRFDFELRTMRVKVGDTLANIIIDYNILSFSDNGLFSIISLFHVPLLFEDYLYHWTKNI